VPIADIPGSYRPEVLPFVLQELETTRALGRADMVDHNKQVMLRTNSHVPPGARLHLLAVGISAYNDDYAKSLRLHYADRDANDLASAIVATQGSLYQVRPQVLCDKDATNSGIMRALAAIRHDMAVSVGNDLAVVHFSGHGAMVDRKLYVLPDEVDARDDAGIKASALSAGASCWNLPATGACWFCWTPATPGRRRWTARRSPSMRTRCAPAWPRRTSPC
jgi:hypothetical protein